MNGKEIRISQLGTRMQDFGAVKGADFPAGSLGMQKFAALNEVVSAIDRHGSRQALTSGFAQTSTGVKKELRALVRSWMKAIRDTAVSLESEHPGISKSFRMPPANGDEMLINSARAFVEAAMPLKSQFVSREMPATFLDDLTEAIARFEEAVSSYNRHCGEHSAETVLLRNNLSQIMKLRRELDPIVRNKYRDDPATLAMWESASRLERAPKRTAPANSGGTTPPTTGG